MAYKSGQEPQKNDEVLGELDGKPARGRVLAVREKTVLITRRAAYGGPGEPLKAEHAEVDPTSLTLVYRPISKTPALPAPSTASGEERARRAKEAAASKPKKEAVKK